MKNDKSLEIIFKDEESVIKPKGSITDVDLVRGIAMLYNTDSKDRVFKHIEAIRGIMEKTSAAKLAELDQEKEEDRKAHLTVVK